MKKLLYILLATVVAFASCTDTPSIDPPLEENPEGEMPEGEKPSDENQNEADQLQRPGSDFKSAYIKQIALWEFTGAWCANCPGGYTNMNFILSTNPDFTEVVHPMAFHSNSTDVDDLAIKETDVIMQDKNLVSLGFPSYIVDLLYGGSLVENVSLTTNLYDTIEDNPCFCGVAVSSTLDGSEAKVTVKLTPELNSAWRMAVYVVEDKVKYYQKDGMKEHDQYTHRHVVRQVVSSSYKGDRIGAQVNPAGQELTADYKITVDAAWNVDNTYVYVLALDNLGYVNNMNCCQINGGNSDYIKL